MKHRPGCIMVEDVETGDLVPVPAELLRHVRGDDYDRALVVGAWLDFMEVIDAMDDPDAEWTSEEFPLLYSLYSELRALGVHFDFQFSETIETLHAAALAPPTEEFLEDGSDSEGHDFDLACREDQKQWIAQDLIQPAEWDELRETRQYRGEGGTHAA